MAKRHPRGERGHGHIEEEDEAPGARVHQPAAEQRPHGGGDAGQSRPGGHGALSVRLRKRGAQQGEAGGHQQGGAHALRGAEQGERPEARCQAAQHRGDREGPQAEEEDAALPPHVPQRAAGQHQGAEREEVCIHRPLEAGQPPSQLAAEGRQGHVDGGAVEEGHAAAEDAREQHTSAARAGIGHGGRGRGGVGRHVPQAWGWALWPAMSPGTGSLRCEHAGRHGPGCSGPAVG